MSRAIVHNTQESRFEWEEDGVLSVLDYQLSGGVLTITHTGVPQAVGGRGIAAELTRAALDTARREGWKVRPVCSYVATYMKRHPDTQDLLAG